ncbi:P-loop NTPase fold protein [Lentilactobacillus sunkii]|uniref:KAP NTPase domain-containing protein n=1 Tax=Lentilactobacillus sunkii DSM 19904 TaxID=1423808 RepID=A0A0R1KZE1_9LACO|nr:P-loop NTPase fold protein [Lentilactobacillus sunkii]KRK88688.1 hypothetical protein FD17_GL002380 [Lentilactobacillus sunkii DSM 19904]
MKNDLILSIENYLKSDDDQAFQIDGPWGSGKTFYAQHMLNKTFSKNNYNPVYLSLNGISSLDNIKKELNRKVLNVFYEKSTEINTVTPKINSFFNMLDEANIPNGLLGAKVGSLFKVTNLYMEKNQKEILTSTEFHNFVIIIDELERFGNAKQIIPVMGYIATIQNEWKCKFVIISNEDSLKGSHQFKKFQTSKEKVINKSWYFGEETKTTALQMITKFTHEDGLDDSLNNWIRTISAELLDLPENINLRTLKSALSSYSEIINKVHNMNLDQKLLMQILKTSYVSVFIITDTIKRNSISRIESFNLLLRRTSGQIQFNKGSLLSAAKNDPNMEPEDISYLIETYHQGVHGFDTSMLYLQSIIDVVLHDQLNANSLINDIRTVLFPKKSAYRRLMDQTIDFREMSEQSFSNLQQEMVTLALKKDTKYAEILGIYANLKYFDGIGLLLIKKVPFNKLKSTILDKINHFSIQQVQSDGYFSLDSINNQQLRKTLKLALDDRMKEVDLGRDKEEIQNLLNFKPQAFKEMGQYFQNNSFFKILIDTNTIDNVLSHNNTGFKGIQGYLTEEILRIKNASNFHEHEIPYGKQFLSNLNESYPKIDDKITKFNFHELIETTSQVIKHLTVK